MQDKQQQKLPFNPSEKELTLGVEIELQVLDQESLLLTPRASDILLHTNDSHFKQEFFQSTLEIISGICNNVQDVEHDLTRKVDIAKSCAQRLGLSLSSTGTHPLADYRERFITPSKRYNELIDRNQWVIRRMAVYGMHMHIGMLSGDHCIRYNYFFMHFLPHVMALSGSSPFWQKMYTGLSSCRPTMYEALPTAGMPYLVRDWKGFEKLYKFLTQSKAINTLNDLWWDLRPSPGIGTLELRFCDEPATLRETLGIVSFVHLLAHWFRDHEAEWIKVHGSLKKWIFRENKWRAIRFGLDAEIVTSQQGKTISLKEDILHWLEMLSPYIKKLGYQPYVEIIKEVVEKGNSSQRQFQVFNETNDLDLVVKHNLQEFYDNQPRWTTVKSS